MNEPTNAVILEAIGGIKAEMKEVRRELVEVRKQTTRTNGRVTRLEQRNELEDNRKDWEKENEGKLMPIVPTNKSERVGVKISDFVKVTLAFLALATALVGTLTVLAGKIN